MGGGPYHWGGGYRHGDTAPYMGRYVYTQICTYIRLRHMLYLGALGKRQRPSEPRARTSGDRELHASGAPQFQGFWAPRLES